jgi:hypothetical protein
MFFDQISFKITLIMNKYPVINVYVLPGLTYLKDK